MQAPHWQKHRWRHSRQHRGPHVVLRSFSLPPYLNWLLTMLIADLRLTLTCKLIRDNLVPLDLRKSTDSNHPRIADVYQELGTQFHPRLWIFCPLRLYLFSFVSCSRISWYRPYPRCLRQYFCCIAVLWSFESSSFLHCVSYVCLALPLLDFSSITHIEWSLTTCQASDCKLLSATHNSCSSSDNVRCVLQLHG